MVKTNSVSVTVTDTQLQDIAECSHRMTEYANRDEGLLITVLCSQEKVEVKLNLDKDCVHSAEQKPSAANSS